MFVVLKLGCNVQKSLNLFGHACLKRSEKMQIKKQRWEC